MGTAAKMPIDGWTAVRMDGRWTDRLVSGGWTEGATAGRMERRWDGWADGRRMDGRNGACMVLALLAADGRTDDRIWTEDGRTAGRFEYLLFDKITY